MQYRGTFCVVALLASIASLRAATPNGPVIIDQKAALHGGISGDCDAPGFPITICAPGSYILASDLVVPANTDGIDIAVPNVTIDLNGFTISGPETCTGVGSSLRCSPYFAGKGITNSGSDITGNMTVRNGTVRGFGLVGVELTSIGNIVDRITASENGAVGILVWQGTVANSTSSRNTSGFVCFAGQLTHNTAYGNSLDGISLNRCSATDNATNYNGEYGLSGFDSLVSGNESDSNGVGDFFNEAGLVSSGNNSCSGKAC